MSQIRNGKRSGRVSIATIFETLGRNRAKDGKNGKNGGWAMEGDEHSS